MDVLEGNVGNTMMWQLIKPRRSQLCDISHAVCSLQIGIVFVSVFILASHTFPCSSAAAANSVLNAAHPRSYHVADRAVTQAGPLRHSEEVSGHINEVGGTGKQAGNGYGVVTNVGDKPVDDEKLTSSLPFSSSSRLTEWRINLLMREGGGRGRENPDDPHPGHYAGYFRLNRTHDTRLFYFFFPSRGDSQSDPVVLWLTGGPGCGSEVAAFCENGPFKLLACPQASSSCTGGVGEGAHMSIFEKMKQTVENGTTERMMPKLTWNEFGWDKVASMIYVDQPVNTGFSYSADRRDVRHDEAGVSDDMYDFLQVFFDAHPDYASRDLFLTGESYGGHYLPALGMRIMHGNGAVADARRLDNRDHYCHLGNNGDDNLSGQVEDGQKADDDDDDGQIPLQGNGHDAGSGDSVYLDGMTTIAGRKSRSSSEKGRRKKYSLTSRCGRILNLRGIAIGNGMTQPEIQYESYADYAFQNGLISEVQYRKIRPLYFPCGIAAHVCGTNGRLSCLLAKVFCGRVFDAVLQKAGKSVNYYDIRKNCDFPPLCYDFSPLERFLNEQSVREDLGVGDRLWKTCSDTVYAAMAVDQMRNLEVGVPKLLEAGIRILVYAGEYDLICNWLGNSRWVARMEWSGKEKYAKATWVGMTVQDKEVGLLSTVEPLTFLKVYNAGHMVPMDQPAVALEMIRRWTRGMSLAGGGEDSNLANGVREE